MTRRAWFHCFAGTAGDMTMAALVDAGADQMMIAEIVGRLDLDGYALTFEPVSRCGIAATQAHVVVPTTTITITITITAIAAIARSAN